MSDFSNYAENALINHLLRNTTLTSPATVYVGLFTAVTDAESGTGTEVTGGSYTRMADAFIASTNGVTSNSGIITFTTATANWSTITHAGLFDAVSAGNPLSALKAIAASKIINSGDIFRFPIGNLTFTIQ